MGAAQEVFVTHTLNASFDAATFELGDVGFGPIVIDVPDGLQAFATRVEFTNPDGSPLFVDFSAALDPATRTVMWTFRSIDPATGELPEDALAGFLPPNDDSERGEGFVEFSVTPLAALPTGTAIRSVATIVFDTNAPIATNQVDPHDPSQGTDPNKEALVTIDATKPSASIGPLPAASGATTFNVSWSGTDQGSGVASFDIFASDNGGAFTLLLDDTTETSTMFTGQLGHTYGFIAVATDNVGLIQDMPAAAQQTISLDTPPTITGLGFLPGGTQPISAFVLAFSEPLAVSVNSNPNSVANYRLFNAGKDKRFGTADDKLLPLRSAAYNAATNSVTVTPTKAIKANQFFRLVVLGAGLLTDLTGNHIDGDGNGTGGDDFRTDRGRGTRLKYTDRDGDSVTLTIAGGVIDLVLAADGEGRDLTLSGTTAASVLSGTVKPRRNPTPQNGVTTLQRVTGLGAGQNRLANPPFGIPPGNIAAQVVDEALRQSSRPTIIGDMVLAGLEDSIQDTQSGE